MNLNVIAHNFHAGIKQSVAIQGLLPGATVMAGGSHAHKTVFLTGLTLTQARRLADVLGAIEACFTVEHDRVSVMPVDVADECARPAGKVVLELLEQDTARFAYFWVDFPDGRVQVIVEILAGDGPTMTVSREVRFSRQGQPVATGFAQLRDAGSGARFIQERFAVNTAREASGYAYWDTRH
ncbi:hypothetical protein [Burkholderia cenocepacia]|uniref:hypothetical protein n=1 Tax=Burkholderia cenocepacia TaxID=95486 RepID=UPI0007617BBB|nr:hypothetical protein [Burkholderia cenocepacia]KWU19163.1 hypothetical protein AS149_13020 [Burkholderia cenocepacia]